MNLKKATLLAFIGSILLLVVSILMAVEIYIYFDASYILNGLSIIGGIFIVIFFYSLYKKQK